MDLSRLPSRRYVDEDAGSGSGSRQQREAAPQRNDGRQQQPQPQQQALPNTTGQPFIPPSQLLQHQHLPPLSAQISTISGSTKYSPGIDYNNGNNKEDLVSPTDTRQYFRDKEGNAYHPSVTFASSSTRSPTSANLPTVSFAAGESSTGGGGGGGGHLHPGMGNRSLEQGGYSGADFKRKKSLVRPERERLNPDGRNFHYAQHSAAFQAENGGRVGISNTGYGPTSSAYAGLPYGGGQGGIASYGLAPGLNGRPGLRRGKSILAREEGMAHESGLNFLKRGATLRRNNNNNSNKKQNKESYGTSSPDELLKGAGGRHGKDSRKDNGNKAALTPWMIYCYIITFFLPGVFLKALGT